MKNFLNIGELARLMNMSTSQIRFYEKKGILKPEKYDPNGYRQYSFKSIDNLEVVTLLKDIKIPIKDISYSFIHSDKVSYSDLIENSEKVLSQEIETLTKKLEKIKRIKNNYSIFTDNKIKIVEEEDRYLTVINNGGYRDHTVRELYNLINDNDYDYTSNDLIFYVLENAKKERLYSYMDILNRPTKKDYKQSLLPKGKYATLKVIVTPDESSEDKYHEFEKECLQLGLNTSSDKIVYYSLETQILSRHAKYLVFQKRILE